MIQPTGVPDQGGVVCDVCLCVVRTEYVSVVRTLDPRGFGGRESESGLQNSRETSRPSGTGVVFYGTRMFSRDYNRTVHSGVKRPIFLTPYSASSSTGFLCLRVNYLSISSPVFVSV